MPCCPEFLKCFSVFCLVDVGMSVTGPPVCVSVDTEGGGQYALAGPPYLLYVITIIIWSE